MREEIKKLKQLCEAHGVSGHEDNVRKMFSSYCKHQTITDNLGSIFGICKGKSDSPRIMVAGHLDEVGFIVQSITDQGYVKFINMGGTWTHVTLGARVRVLNQQNQEIIGVITAPPPHFLSKKDMEKVLGISEMFIDIGAGSKAEVTDKLKVNLGDPITFDSSFTQLSNKDVYVGKALDNRVGVGIALEVANMLNPENLPNTAYLGASVQEELGARGGITSTNLINPDIAIVLEGTPADDLPNNNINQQQGAMGKGVQLRLVDPTTVTHKKLNQFIISTANDLSIPIQIAVRNNGGTDAKQIHTHNIGVPTAVLGVPVRYTHSGNSLINIQDYLYTIELVKNILLRLNDKKYTDLVDFN